MKNNVWVGGGYIYEESRHRTKRFGSRR